jgi:hypothetical protein
VWRWAVKYEVPISAALLIAGLLAAHQYLPGPDGYPLLRLTSASEMKSHPDSLLSYPGSTQLRSYSEEMTPNNIIEPGNAASVTTVLGANSSSADITAWYESQLGSSGWSDQGPFGAGRWWKRGFRETFVLRFVPPSSIEYTTTDRSTEFFVIYELSVPWYVSF